MISIHIGTIIIGFSAVAAAGIIGTVFVWLTHPEKIEKLGSLLTRFVAGISVWSSKKYVSLDIQGRINDYAKGLSKKIKNYDPIGVRVEWVDNKEDREAFFEKDRLVIRLDNHRRQNKNFVIAMMIFLSHSFLNKTKIHINERQKQSIDLFVGKKLIKQEKQQVRSYFHEEYFAKMLKHDRRLCDYIDQFEKIDKVGVFFSAYIQELSFLGEKSFYRRDGQTIISEVDELGNFLARYADREMGEQIFLDFERYFLKCGIVLVGRKSKKHLEGTKPYISRIEKLSRNHIENIYLIGPGDESGKGFIRAVAMGAINQFDYYIYDEKIFTARLKMDGERISKKSFLILLRTNNPKYHYDSESQNTEPA